jgi:hypothetical protein
LCISVASLIGAATVLAAPLSGSTFEGDDGNMLVNTSGNTDWCNQPIATFTSGICPAANRAPNLSIGPDLPSGKNDNAFGQGTKEDNAAVTVVNGSIPPNKNDLTRFYEASETVSGNTFLYLAWERAVNIGNANLDFEINQATTTGFDASTTGAITLNRTPGDVLVTYDFGGSGSPTLGLLRWLTSTTNPVVTGFSPNVCFSSNSFPCWGDHVTLNGTNSEGQVNTSSIYEPYVGSALGIGLFGEAAINLTGAGVIAAGTCSSFATTFVKSRSSSAFGAEVKDFIAPIPTTISNCGEIKIIKNTDPRNIDQDFSYSTNVHSGSATGAATFSKAPDSTGITTTFTLNDGANKTNTEDITKVPVGSYTVTEGSEPPNFTLKSLTCTASAGSSGSQDGTNPSQANISVIADGLVTCTYVNQASGAILVTKTAKNHNLVAGSGPLAGAVFTVNGVDKTTDANGHACFDGLTIGTAYTVTETSAPAGYSIDTTSKSVTPLGAASCTSGTPTGVSFTDLPLTDLVVTATSELAGATNSTITCVVQGTTTGIGNSPQGPADPVTVTANGLTPGTYTCTVDVDP